MVATQSVLDIIVQMNIEAAKGELMKLKQIVSSMNQPVKDPMVEATAKKAKLAKAEAKMIADTNLAYSKNINFEMLRKEYQELNVIGQQLGRNSKEFKTQKVVVDTMNKQLGITKAQMATINHRSKKFNFDFLTLLFVGMMLTRTFGGMFKNIINSYKKITGLTSEFNRSTLKLQASFGYLKFAIGSALNSPWVINAIEWFTNKIIWLGDVMAERPGLALWIVGIIAALATIGTLASIASGIIQFRMMVNIAAATKAVAAATNLTALAKGSTIFGKSIEGLGLGVSTMSGLIIGVIAVIVVFGMLFALLNEDKSVRDWGVNALTSMVKVIVSLTAFALKFTIRLTEIGAIWLDYIVEYNKGIWSSMKTNVINFVDWLITVRDMLLSLLTGNDIKGAWQELKNQSLKVLKGQIDNAKDIIMPDVIFNPSETDLHTEEIADMYNDLISSITGNNEDLRAEIDATFGGTMKDGLDIIYGVDESINKSLSPTIAGLTEQIKGEMSTAFIDLNNEMINSTEVVLPNTSTALDSTGKYVDTLTNKYDKLTAAIKRANDAQAKKKTPATSDLLPSHYGTAPMQSYSTSTN